MRDHKTVDGPTCFISSWVQGEKTLGSGEQTPLNSRYENGDLHIQELGEGAHSGCVLLSPHAYHTRVRDAPVPDFQDLSAPGDDKS